MHVARALPAVAARKYRVCALLLARLFKLARDELDRVFVFYLDPFVKSAKLGLWIIGIGEVGFSHHRRFDARVINEIRHRILKSIWNFRGDLPRRGFYDLAVFNARF